MVREGTPIGGVGNRLGRIVQHEPSLAPDLQCFERAGEGRKSVAFRDKIRLRSLTEEIPRATRGRFGRRRFGHRIDDTR